MSLNELVYLRWGIIKDEKFIYMKRIFKISILLISVILFSCSNGNKRYHIDETTSSSDTITYLKSDMSLLNGIVYSEFGENGKYINRIFRRFR